MRVEWVQTHEGLRPFMDGHRVAFAPQPGSQERFLACSVAEACYGGTRGPGKTIALIMDFVQFCGPRYNFGRRWTGILFRRTFPELSDVIEKSKEWIPKIFPTAKFNEGKYTWHFPGGERLIFAHMRTVADYAKYHGHEYPWIGWEELTTWPDDTCYVKMMSCMRSTHPGVAAVARCRSTTNPGMVGHNWVKKRFCFPVPPGHVRGPIIKTPTLPDRVGFHGTLAENKVLTSSDPGYLARLLASANGNINTIKAWRDGSWDIVAGGMFDDLWEPLWHVVPMLLPKNVPSGWRMDRAYDDGQSKPFSVGWWAQSNGEPITVDGFKIGPVPGDLVRIAEWYGCNAGEENVGLKLASWQIAAGIRERQKKMEIDGRVAAGPADTNIWNADPRDPNNSIASAMSGKPHQVHWEPADKGPGSRKLGWRTLRDRLVGGMHVGDELGEDGMPKPARGPDGAPLLTGRRERPGIFATPNCPDFLRCFPVTPRDKTDAEDVDTESEDHIADETRYRARKPRVVVTRTAVSMH